ncbi:MAG TPA: SUF system NifU family Fe-S cluster assembly protein [Polyangiaceae bacterium]
MSDLRDLYQELILDHGRRPRNFKALEGANCSADGHNPLCGDRLQLRLKCEHDRIVDIGFQGAGCAICMASASTMSEAIKGHTREEVQTLFRHFIGLVVEGRPEEADALPAKLGVFSGVAEFPMRVKCATLAWHTLEAALFGRDRATSEGS